MLLIIFTAKQKNVTGHDGTAAVERFSNKDPATLEYIPPMYWEVENVLLSKA